ncbi:MAG TPA: Gfo/Idh/MocA family oxidoreductase, partial [Pseudolabrys sp.]|nr:Gfo/Idh/MocA family oxidoreductase [Pseudolabrys sp.]
RADESGNRFSVDVDDRSITLAELENGAVGTIISTWATRVRRDDLMTLQIDGTGGSAVAGLHRCWVQSKADTPTVRHFNPDVDIGADYHAGWREYNGAIRKANPYRVGWEDFLRHVVTGAPLRNTFAAGIRDVQFAEACKRSATEKRWVEIE